MTSWTLIRRSLRFHARAHLGVVLGATVGSAALIGALVVGDSVKQTLRERALARLGPIHFALQTSDKLFRADLAQRIAQTAENAPGFSPALFSSALILPGIVTRPDDSARANQVAIIGVDPKTWPRLAGWDSAGGPPMASWSQGETALINEALARQLGVRNGDDLVVRVQKPSALGLDAAISPREEDSVAIRLQAGGVLGPAALGDFGLTANQLPPANLFLPLDFLAQKLAVPGNANFLASAPRGGRNDASRWLDHLNAQLERSWLPEDAGLVVRALEQPPASTGGEAIPPAVEISTSRIFLEPPVVATALPTRTTPLPNQPGPAPSFPTNGFGLLTYLANLIRSGERSTPYSIVTAAGAPYTPAEMADDEILVNDWLAEDLQVKPGDELQLSYFVVDSGSRLIERTNSFRVRHIVPLRGIYGDRTLMPEFPGLAKAESTHDWDAGFPLVHTIRDKDEDYWKKYRGTPKAFITLATGQKIWSNRFGSLTAIRYSVPANSVAAAFRESVYRSLLAKLQPAELGFRFEPVRQQALQAASQAQDFGQLFLGFSIFLVISALLLMALLFQFGLEQRMMETGTLLALGLSPKQVRRLFLAEGLMLAIVGGVLGAVGGLFYAKAMLWALTTIWRSAVGTSALGFHASLATLLIGFLASTVVAGLTIWVTLRKQARRPAVSLLTGEAAVPATTPKHRTPWLGIVFGAVAILMLAWSVVKRDAANPGIFFGAGALMLLASLSLAAAGLRGLASRAQPVKLTLTKLAVSGSARRRSRSMATIALLACGSFVIAALGNFRLEADREAARPSSGTGGFTLIAASTLPVLQDLNTPEGRSALALGEAELRGVRFVPFRVRQGDDASCLNLNRAQRPRLMAVDPKLLAGRFTFAETAKGFERQREWALLSGTPGKQKENDEVAAIGDVNSIRWALGKKVGDTMEYTDERGGVFNVRLIGALANSLLQGNLIIDEAEFVKRYPNESGYRYFLIDAPGHSVSNTAAALTRALRDLGFEVTPAADRLNAFNAVQNTYLGTFQVLGGLGLLLGSAGLAVVVLRNVLERRAELGLFLALGFRRRTLYCLLFGEHTALLCAGLGLGVLSAAVAVLPSILAPGAHLPSVSVALTLAALTLSGVLWTLLATGFALRGQLLDALRNE